MRDHAPDIDDATSRPLELDGPAFRAVMEGVLSRLDPLLTALRDTPASWAGGSASESQALPWSGAPLEEVLDDLFARLPAGINTAAPGFMGYIPGGGVPLAAVADLIGDVINRYVGISPPAPNLAALERDVIGWFCSIIGYPATAGGTFTSGGSAANLIGVVAAREDRFPATASGGTAEALDMRRGTVYVSDQAHHSVMKAARFAGIAADRVRVIGTDREARMRPDLLQERIAADREEGLLPFLLVANAGTTNTGAVDPLRELADVARGENLWLHVDAAYGGFFRLTQRGREALVGLERADSVVLDPHKTLFLPYGTGALLVRDPARVAQALAISADYLPPAEAGRVETADLSFELTRPFRGLRVWLPLRVHGADAFVRLLDEKLDLAQRLEAALGEMPHVELIARPQLSTLAFALAARAGEGLEAVNERTRGLLERINGSRRVLVTGTTLRGRFVIRPSIVSFRTHQAQVDILAELIRGAR
jgi:aromatic-L-amino-acid/L-tryptophan decarboxylase